MKSEWKNFKLGHITSWKSGGTPSKENTSFWNGDIPWISANSMLTNRIERSDLNITLEGLRNGSRLVPKDTILLLVRGGALHSRIPLGITMRDVAFNQDVKAVIADTNYVDTWFLFFWFIGNVNMLLKKVEFTGIGAGKLDTKLLQDLIIELPPIEEQKKIVSLIKSLDDKIELNRKMNATLEQIAQTIFKSWFVDFDPVKAKAAGREPEGMDAETAALFPSDFEQSELGMIPKGWQISKTSNIGKIITGKTPSTFIKEYYGDDVLFITIPDMHNNVFVINTNKRLSKIGEQSQSNKTLPTGAICVSCIATPGLIIITGAISQTNQQINSVIPFEPNTEYFWFWVFKFLSENIKTIGSGGSVYANLNKKDFENLLVLFPRRDLIATYHLKVEPIFKKILINIQEASVLSDLRDSLLPKLISGQLQII